MNTPETTLPEATSDVFDRFGDTARSCDAPLRDFGGRVRFSGVVTTLDCREDNLLLKALLDEDGHGRVAVVAAGGTLHCAMLGDNMAARAAAHGWEGIVIDGAIRDSAAVRRIGIGVKALGTNPRRSRKHGDGSRDVPVAFGGVVFHPGDRLVADEDGVVVVAPG